MKRQADETWHPMDLQQLQRDFPYDAERLRLHLQGLLERGVEQEVLIEEFHVRADTVCQLAKRLRVLGRRPRAAPLFCRAGCGWPSWEKGFCLLHAPKRKKECRARGRA